MKPLDAPIRPHGNERVTRRALRVALVVAAAGFALLRLGSEMLEGETQAFDEQVLRAFRRPGDPGKLIGPSWLEQAMLDVTALGGPTVIGLGVALTVIYLCLARRPRAAVRAFLSTAGAFLLVYALKSLFARARPSVVPPLSAAASASFPSGHAALSAAVYLTLAAALARDARPAARRFVLFVGVLIPVLVGLTRVAIGVHYPSDVLAGWIVGAAWALLSSALSRSRADAPASDARPDTPRGTKPEAD